MSNCLKIEYYSNFDAFLCMISVLDVLTQYLLKNKRD